MIKTIYFVFFICAFALGLWACTGKEQEKFKSLSTAHFEQLIKAVSYTHLTLPTN